MPAINLRSARALTTAFVVVLGALSAAGGCPPVLAQDVLAPKADPVKSEPPKNDAPKSEQSIDKQPQGPSKPAVEPAVQPTDPTKPVPRRRPVAAAAPTTVPAPGREECAWVGKRIISLLVRDDAMTAGDFGPFYQRFLCPEDHLSQAFGCVVANLDTIESGALADQVDECWREPALRYEKPEDKSPIEPSRPKVEAPAARRY